MCKRYFVMYHFTGEAGKTDFETAFGIILVKAEEILK